MEIEYIREIEGHEYIYEVLTETFGNIFQMLCPGTIVFGGAVRDALAGMDVSGDLDILITPRGFNQIVHVIENDVRWSSTNNNLGRMGKYKNTLAISDIREYTNYNGKVVQFIINGDDPSSQSGMKNLLLSYGMNDEEILFKLFNTARGVDIVCCGVVMTHEGRIYELLPNAYNDCINRILRINKEAKNLNLEKLRTRIGKLTARGWKSDIDFKLAIRTALSSTNKSKESKIGKSNKRIN